MKREFGPYDLMRYNRDLEVEMVLWNQALKIGKRVEIVIRFIAIRYQLCRLARDWLRLSKGSRDGREGEIREIEEREEKEKKNRSDEWVWNYGLISVPSLLFVYN